MVSVLAVLAAVAGCGGGSAGTAATTATTAVTPAASTPSATGSQLSTKVLAGLGSVLVDAQGHTLYIFLPDNRTRVSCQGTCAQIWPPVKLANSQKPVASGELQPSLLSSDPDPEGGRVVTYAGWPLYTYISDTAPDTAAGQALNANGGLWYVLSPSGAVITKTP